jgi:transcriptional regulator with XRE-family HTH domain
MMLAMGLHLWPRELTNQETQGLTILETLVTLLSLSDLGTYLRGLRHRKKRSLKKAAPELQLSVSYLSKIETGRLVPPPETAERLAQYYGVDVEGINALAGRLPDDVVRILQGNPDEAIRLLREKFGAKH